MDPRNTDLTVSLPIPINKQISTIKKLFINHPCSFNELFTIISYTSQISHLSFIHKYGSGLKSENISPMILSNLTHLSVDGNDLTFDELEIFISKLYLNLKVLSIAQIYHLKICEKLFNGTLIEVLLLLPELNSLQILSLTLSHQTYLSVDEVELAVISKKNQITKVYLEKMFAIEEIYFLIELCPHMLYLKIDFFNNMDIELFVRLILTKIQTKSNCQLRLLCFCVAAADDKMIEKLNQIIYSEKLLFNYTIKRILENIYLQWK